MPEYRFDEIAINSKEKKKPTEADKDTYIGLEHLDTGSLKVSRWGSEVAPTGEKLVMHKGDVLFGKRRAYQKKVAIAPFDGIFSAHGMVLRPQESVITKDYFPLFISSDYFLDAAIKISVGSLSPTINWSDLKELTFQIPTIEEQKRLAPVIWAAIDTQNAYKKLLLGIDELVKSQFIEMFGTYKDSPYSVKNLEEICEPIKDGTHQTPTYTDDKQNGYPFFSSKDVASRYMDWDHPMYIPAELHEQLYKRIAPRKGDILLAKNGTTGIAAIVDRDEVFDIYVSLALLRPRQGNNVKYLWQAINMPETKMQFDSSLKGIGVPNLHLGEIKKAKIVVPPLEIQEQFVGILEQSDKSKFVVLQATISKILSIIMKSL